MGEFGGIAKSQEFTSSGTWTRPPGVEWADVYLVGGGGGGAGSASGGEGGGGGGGGQVIYARVRVTGDVTVTIGAAAAGGASGNNDGIVGNNSTFGALLTALGGAQGLRPAGNGYGGNGGGYSAASSNLLAAQAGPGQGGIADTATGNAQLGLFSIGGGGGFGKTAGNPGASCIHPYGVGAGGAGSTYAGGGGGSYGAGGAGGENSDGVAAAANSGGGGGGGDKPSGTDHAGGDGGSGYCVVFWIE